MSAPLRGYTSDISSSEAWLDGQQLPDGAILYSSSEIEPYFANLGASGLTKTPGQLPHVVAWMRWFVNHINTTDVWGLGGTIYDYTYSGGVETPTDTADSVDSYNSTFLTLARLLYDTGDPTSRRYVVSIQPTLERLATSMLKLQQSDGLTIALPRYGEAYLMDNSEVYRGLIDLAYLESDAFGNPSGASTYTLASTRVQSGISSLWNAAASNYSYAKGEPGGTVATSSWSTWYPDATAQIFPIVNGVIEPTSSRAKSLWATFNKDYAPDWEKLDNSDSFPWAVVADAAVLMGDTTAAETYVQNVQTEYANKGYPWPWYCAEDGWYVRAINQLDIGASYEVADN